MRKYTNVTSIIEPVEQLSDAIALNSLLFKAAEHFFFFFYLVAESNQWKRVTRNGINWDGPTGKACFSGRN